MRPVDYAKVRRLVSIGKVLGFLDWKWDWENGYLHRGPCPIHGSKNPHSRTFTVQPDKWYCYTCDQGGDQIDLWAIRAGLSRRDAAIELCKLAGQEVPYLPQQRHRRS